MEALFDSSSWISLARAGLLGLLPRLPVTPVLLDVVWQEVVEAGLDAGHPDAALLNTALSGLPIVSTERTTSVIEAVVLAQSLAVGVLVSNDLPLGRRSRNLGVDWLRTADLLLLAQRSGRVSTIEARQAVTSLRSAARIDSTAEESYLRSLS